MVNILPLPGNLKDSADWLVQAIDPQARLARLVRMDEHEYRQASFLDDRLLGDGVEVRLCSLDDLVAVSAEIQIDLTSWIFHIGHVGSTLVSRLLGEIDRVLALREPRSLRDLGAVEESERVAVALALRKLMGRSLAPGQQVLVKATSFVSELAPLLIAPGASALFMFATPRNYVASILAGENSVKELAALHETRAQRLGERGISFSGFDRGDAYRAAAAWACEMTSLESAACSRPDAAILWADFDVMLGDMAGWLGRCTEHFEMTASRERLEELAAGPLMRRYSKAQEYDYSPALRVELLAEAEREHRAEIDAALAALASAATDHPLLARAIDRAGGEI